MELMVVKVEGMLRTLGASRVQPKRGQRPFYRDKARHAPKL